MNDLYLVILRYRMNVQKLDSRSEHLHEDLQSRAYLECSDSNTNRLEVAKTRVQEMEAWEVEVLHFV